MVVLVVVLCSVARHLRGGGMLMGCAPSSSIAAQGPLRLPCPTMVELELARSAALARRGAQAHLALPRARRPAALAWRGAPARLVGGVGPRRTSNSPNHAGPVRA
jgi:hypothetical protein